MAEPSFLTSEQLLVIHGLSIERYGSALGKTNSDVVWVRDETLLESALFAPQATFEGKYLYRTLGQMAGALWHSLAINHPFLDGNKRVALAACSVFLQMNGLRLTWNNDEAERYTLAVCTGELSRNEAIALVEGSTAQLGA